MINCVSCPKVRTPEQVKRDGNMCSACRMRRMKENNPVRWSYTKLKANAKRRGVGFELTLLEFEEFCDSNPEFLAMRGKRADSSSLDRIRGNEPYRLGNLQVLSLSENSKKGHLDLRIPAGEHPFSE